MAAGISTIAPLSNSQKLFLQRLLVSHALTDEEARALYESIKEGFANVKVPSQDQDEDEEEEGGGQRGIDHAYMGNSFEHCLGIINASLLPAFQLEIATVRLPRPYDADEDDSQKQPLGPKSPGERKRSNLVKYHAIVNRSNDDFAKSYAFQPAMGGPHEMAFFRLVLEKIVERGVENIESGSIAATSDSAVGCPGALNRMDVINLRLEMEGAHKDKLSIRETERALEMLQEQKWLVEVAPPAEDDSDDDGEQEGEDAGEKEEDGGIEEDAGEEGRRPKRRRKKRPSSRGSRSRGSRRKSLKGTFYGIGPRSFMELGDFLEKAGLPGDRMPQSILHRA